MEMEHQTDSERLLSFPPSPPQVVTRVVIKGTIEVVAPMLHITVTQLFFSPININMENCKLAPLEHTYRHNYSYTLYTLYSLLLLISLCFVLTCCQIIIT